MVFWPLVEVLVRSQLVNERRVRGLAFLVVELLELDFLQRLVALDRLARLAEFVVEVIHFEVVLELAGSVAIVFVVLVSLWVFQVPRVTDFAVVLRLALVLVAIIIIVDVQWEVVETLIVFPRADGIGIDFCLRADAIFR